MYKALCSFLMLPKGEKRYVSRNYVLKEDDMYQGGQRYASSAKRECHI